MFAAEKHNGCDLFREKFAPAKSRHRFSLAAYQGDEARLIVAVSRDWLNEDGLL